MTKTLPAWIRPLIAATALAFVALALPAAKAHAISLGAEGGASSLGGDAHLGYKSLSPFIGASLRFGLAPGVEFGGFYDSNFITTDPGSTAGSKTFWGGLLQLGLAPFFFIEGRIGATRLSLGGASSGTGLGYGGYLGYKWISAGWVRLTPVIGWRSFPTEGSNGVNAPGSALDFGLRLTLGN